MNYSICFSELLEQYQKKSDNGEAEKLPSDFKDIALAFFELGRTFQQTERPSDIELLSMLRASQVVLKQEYPLKRQQAVKDYIKGRFQSEAILIFNADSDNELRVGELAKTLYQGLNNFPEVTEHYPEGKIKDLMPTVETVRKWISEIAPDYARKGGRPKKDK